MLKRIFTYVILLLFSPTLVCTGTNGTHFFSQEIVSSVAPVFSYNQSMLLTETDLLAQAELENERAKGKQTEIGKVTEENTSDGLKYTDDMEPEEGIEQEQEMEPEDGTKQSDDMEWANFIGKSDEMEQTDSDGQTETMGQNDVASQKDIAEDIEKELELEVSKEKHLLEKLDDFDYLIQNYYIVDSSTTISSKELRASELINRDMSLKENVDGPQVLIYHTHSQEGYADSAEGDMSASVMALGEYLSTLLNDTYHISTMHHTGQYDVEDRDHAYSNAAPELEKILSENPTIEVVIDLHRDSVPEDRRLITEVCGKPTAKIMFFNGLCKTTARGELSYLPNPNLEDNLAFSLQMQLAAEELFPDFTRKIYLKGYRYNMHYCPKSLLVEVGAQNNTFEEGMNAMEPLAKILAKVLDKGAE